LETPGLAYQERQSGITCRCRISKKILLPADLREDDLEYQVESEANQYIPFALEEVNLDFQVIGTAPTIR